MKRNNRKLMAWSLVVLGLAAGCGVNMGGRKDHRLIQAYGPETPQAMTTAPADGEYVLYRGVDGPPIARNFVKAGEPVGFKTDAIDMDKKAVGPRGTISAVAGELAFPIVVTETYEWRRLKGSDPKTAKSNPYWPQP